MLIAKERYLVVMEQWMISQTSAGLNTITTYNLHDSSISTYYREHDVIKNHSSVTDDIKNQSCVE